MVDMQLLGFIIWVLVSNIETVMLWLEYLRVRYSKKPSRL
jgi:hypothetical protein